MKLPAYLLLLLLCVCEHTYAQQQPVRFSRLSLKDGLSHTSVGSIVEDKQGFIWFATGDGLNKYDGYKFTVYQNNPRDSTSITSNNLQHVFIDSKGNLWISTNGGGLNLYDRKHDSFIAYQSRYNDSTTLSSGAVMNMAEEQQGNLWVGTYTNLSLFYPKTGKVKQYKFREGDPTGLSGEVITATLVDAHNNVWVGTKNGLNTFDRATQTFKHYQHDAANPSTISHNSINALEEDEFGRIWVGTEQGLNCFNPKTQTFTRFIQDPSKPNSLSNNAVTALYSEGKGMLWVGTNGGGVNLMRTQTGQFTSYQHHPEDEGSLSHSQVASLLVDSKGILWVGTAGGGISKYDRNLNAFMHYHQDPTRPWTNPLNSNGIAAFAEAKNGDIWVGTTGGVNVLNKQTNQFTYYSHQDNDPKSLSNNTVLSMLSDRDGYIWVGTYSGGVNKFDPATNNFTHYQIDATPASLSGNDVYALLEDHEGNIWIATNNGGVNRLDKKTNTVTKYMTDSGRENNISTNCIRSLYEDRRGNIWIGTYGAGVNMLNPKTNAITYYGAGETGLSNSVIYCMFEDSHQNIWLGTLGGGLNLFDQEKQKFTSIRAVDGLSNDVVNGIAEDKQGYLWISTNKGITRYHPEKKTFKNYDVKDGLQSYAFTKGAYLQGRGGELYFGGDNGFNVIYPEHLTQNRYMPSLAFTDFKLFNESVKIGESSILASHISEAKDVTLSYDQSVFTFDFVALNFSLSERNQYAYKLEGFDKNWNFIGSKHSATYTNLDPGEYTFHVKASNNDGIWNEKGISIKVTITPPFWMTWWFRTLVFFTVIGSAISFYRVRMNVIKAQKVELEKQVLERTAEVVHQKEELQTQSEHLLIINSELQEKQEEILQQQEELQATADQLQSSKEEIELQRDNLQQINEQVMSSIKYANTIQKAILPSTNKIREVFPEHFILYCPKDVVSGDFYWFVHLPKEDSGLDTDLSFFAVVDCTGHGVPGAFMSIIGSTLLNEIVKQKGILDPAQILEQLHQGIKQAVAKAEGINTAGMDVCLCQVEKGEGNQMKLLFAGAKRNLLLVRPGSNTIEVMEADRRSIGSNSANPFTTQQLLVEPGTCLYLTSDGYTDQNNVARKKLGIVKLRELILQAAPLSADKQKRLFEQALDQHQQKAEQRDDITLLGITI